MVAFGPTVVPAPMTAAGSTLAVGWIEMPSRSSAITSVASATT